MKILIAEDNSAMRSLIRQFCQGVAQEVLECRNGLEAIALYEAARPDWVLMDIVMPELDGLKATARLRETFPEARIIIVTDNDTREYRVAARRAGALHFVCKDNLRELRGLMVP